ncbi:MAG: endolytic transglycosylase MltG [Desulfobacterales bacterium]
MKKKLTILLTAGCLIIGLAVYVAADIYLFAHRPADKFTAQTMAFHISPARRSDRISDNLHQHNLIASPAKFKIIARFNDHDQNIIAGEYALSPAMTPLQILKKLSGGIVIRLSIPEGYAIVPDSRKKWKRPGFVTARHSSVPPRMKRSGPQAGY